MDRRFDSSKNHQQSNFKLIVKMNKFSIYTKLADEKKLALVEKILKNLTKIFDNLL
jgi:hypothetical protein